MNFVKAFYRTAYFILLILVLLLPGCAGRRLPHAPVVFGQERRTVVAVFYDMLARHRHCDNSLDAAVNLKLSVSAFLGKKAGTLAGYLQALAPSYLKFVGINPLGQPLLIFVTNGSRFHYVSVPDGKGFEGDVRSRTFMKYAPPGFDPEYVFYWLAGRLGPGRIDILEVRRDEDGQGYWLELSAAGKTKKHIHSRLLIDIDKKIMLRHLLQDEGGRILMEIKYGSHEGEGGCLIPRKIVVTSLTNHYSAVVLLTDMATDVSLSRSDFEFNLPGGFKREVVE